MQMADLAVSWTRNLKGTHGFRDAPPPCPASQTHHSMEKEKLEWSRLQ